MTWSKKLLSSGQLFQHLVFVLYTILPFTAALPDNRKLFSEALRPKREKNWRYLWIDDCVTKARKTFNSLVYKIALTSNLNAVLIGFLVYFPRVPEPTRSALIGSIFPIDIGNMIKSNELSACVRPFNILTFAANENAMMTCLILLPHAIAMLLSLVYLKPDLPTAIVFCTAYVTITLHPIAVVTAAMKV